MATTLPLSKDIQAASSDSLKSQTLLFQAVEYGTDSRDDALKERTQAACKVLADSWENCVELENALVDVLWLCGCKIIASQNQQDSTKALVEIIKALLTVPDRVDFHRKLESSLVPSLVGSAGIGDELDLLKRLRQHNTQAHYKQQKFNLLQEESEGYAKVLQFLLSKDCDATEMDRKLQLQHLLGAFELDGNRVLDLAFDALEAELFPLEGTGKDSASFKPPHHTSVSNRILDTMRDLATDSLPSLIHFKLEKDTSQRILNTVASLHLSGILSLSALANDFYGPLEQQIKDAHKVFWMKEKRRVLAKTRVSLSGGSKGDPKEAELSQRLSDALIPLNSKPILHILLTFLKWDKWEKVKDILPMDSWRQLCDLFPELFGSGFCNMAGVRLKHWYESNVERLDLSETNGAISDETMSDVVSIDAIVDKVSEPLLCTLSSGCLSNQSLLYVQICRLLRSSMTDNEETTLSDNVYSFFKSFLVPVMSLFPANPAIASELWSVVSKLSYVTRYRLYADWRGAGLERSGLTSPLGKPLPLVESEIDAGKAVRYSLKRLSKENIRGMSRSLAKVVHANPLVVFATILSQIESYDNMVEVMVEAQRYVSPLGLDVLSYCILSRLSGMSGGVNRSRFKDDGVNVSQWLQSLEAFTGAFFKRCPFVEFRGILSYLMRRLKTGNVMELGILRTLLKVPGGYSFADYAPAASLSAVQLEGRAGSISLKRETMSFGIVEGTNAKAADSVRQVLQSDGFGVSMLILVAQVRASILFGGPSTAMQPVKLVGNLFDSAQVVLSILAEFLVNDDNTTSLLKYAEALPTMGQLTGEFGFDTVTSWMLCRPLVKTVDTLEAVASKSNDKKLVEKLRAFSPSDGLQAFYEDMLPSQEWSDLSFELFEVFFSNGLSDIFIPEDVYASERTRIGKEIERLDQRQKGGNQLSLQPGQSTPMEDVHELERLKKVANLLKADVESQNERIEIYAKDLEERKDALFKSDEVSQSSVLSFLTNCVYPRSLTSPDDAMYCAHFSLQLHIREVPGFSILHYVNELVSLISGSLFGVTEGEGAHLAILLLETWKQVVEWRYDESNFQHMVATKPGAFMETDGGDDDRKAVTYAELKTLYTAWHAKVGTALIGCLRSPEYMHTRTGLSVLTRLVEFFPTKPQLGNKLLKELGPLQDENNSRPDIRASANAYATMLTKARDEGKWLEEDAAAAKARAEKVKAVAEERKKKQQEIFKQLQKDTDKITDEIGPRDGGRDRFDRRRGDRRDFGNSGGRPEPVDRARGNNDINESNTREHRDRGRRGSPPRDQDRRSDRDRDRDRGRGDGDGVWRRDGLSSRDDRESGGRWPRGDGATRSSKRRAPSPEPETEGRGAKRQRTSQDGDGKFESRRSASSRGPSPALRTSTRSRKGGKR